MKKLDTDNIFSELSEGSVFFKDARKQALERPSEIEVDDDISETSKAQRLAEQKKPVKSRTPQKPDFTQVKKQLSKEEKTDGSTNKRAAIQKEKRANIIHKDATQVPNKYLDRLIPFLRPAEIAVFLYIIRKTYGYNKLEGDYISYSQFMTGAGDQDFGCGLSRASLSKALKSLSSYRLITIGKATKIGTFYSIDGLGCNEFIASIERIVSNISKSIDKRTNPQEFRTAVTRECRKIYS